MDDPLVPDINNGPWMTRSFLTLTKDGPWITLSSLTLTKMFMDDTLRNHEFLPDEHGQV